MRLHVPQGELDVAAWLKQQIKDVAILFVGSGSDSGTQRAIGLLQQCDSLKGFNFVDIDESLDHETALRDATCEIVGEHTLPQLWVNGVHVANGERIEQVGSDVDKRQFTRFCDR